MVLNTPGHLGDKPDVLGLNCPFRRPSATCLSIFDHPLVRRGLARHQPFPKALHGVDDYFIAAARDRVCAEGHPSSLGRNHLLDQDSHPIRRQAM